MNFDISSAIDVLAATPATLRALLGGLSDEWTVGERTTPTSQSLGHPSLDKEGSSAANSTIQSPKSKIQNTEWLPFDVVGHLIHGEETDWIPRARIILEQGENRTFIPFDRFAQFEKSKGKSLVELLDEFARLRARNLDTLVSWELTEEHLDLEGVHPELGQVTLRELLATWVVHDLNHIRQVVTALAKRYSGEVGVWKEYLSILNDR